METEEHREFLRHIGCEKQQGYLYGKPEPYSEEYLAHLDSELGIEHDNERQYYRAIGQVNTLSLSEDDFVAERTDKDYVTSMPLAFVEYADDRFTVLDYNNPFLAGLRAIGISDIETAEFLINDTTRLPARTSRRLMGTIGTEKFARHDYIANGKMCVMRAKHVASHGLRTTVLVTIDSSERLSERQRRNRRAKTLESLYSVYEHVDILDFDRNRIVAVHSQATFHLLYDTTTIEEAVKLFAADCIFPADRDRYFRFFDPDTLLQRIDAHSQHFLVAFFRMHDMGGDYAWKLFSVIKMVGEPGSKVLVCIRDTNWENDALLQAAYEQTEEDGAFNDLQSLSTAADLRMTDGSLWRAIVQMPSIGMFWKDADRRFIGCNQAFLDYYGFESVDDIRGKTDEDMGWHVNPIPFMKDELSVLEEGNAIEFEPGRCIAKGMEREIIASKRPVYRNGKIIGLVGFFFDITEPLITGTRVDSLHYTDLATGTLNYAGLDAAIGRYVESYQRNGIDFTSMMLVIENFQRFNELYGYEFEDALLRTVSDAIREVVGVTCVVGHFYADRFVILLQEADDESARSIGDAIVDALEAIPEVDGRPCTIFAHYSCARFSEAGSVAGMNRLLRARLQEVRNRD